MAGLSLNLDTPDLARHYEEASSNRQLKAGKVLVEKLGLRPGARVLDVGSGTGLLADHVAGIVGPSGSVVAIDPLPLRIEIAKRRSPNLDFRVGDAYDLGGFPGGAFDAVYLNAVFHWLPEKLGPLREFHRILKGGGRLGITTGSKDHVSPLQAIRKKVLAREPYALFPESRAGVAERVGADELRDLLVQSGFEVRSIELSPTSMPRSARATKPPARLAPSTRLDRPTRGGLCEGHRRPTWHVLAQPNLAMIDERADGGTSRVMLTRDQASRLSAGHDARRPPLRPKPKSETNTRNRRGVDLRVCLLLGGLSGPGHRS